jgi:hypothetical protein
MEDRPSNLTKTINFACSRANHMKTVITIAPKFKQFSSFVDSLPKVFNSEGTSIYKARNEIKNFEIDGTLFTVKGYKRPHIINRIAYSSFRQSKAKRAYDYALRLLEKNISTPEPVAYIEQYECGLLCNSYFVSLFATESHLLRELHDYKVEGNEALLNALAAYTAYIHERDVFPIDYSPGNVLFENEDGNFRFTLLDINRMQFRVVNQKMAAKSFRRFTMDQSLIGFIAKEYARIRGYEPTTFACEAIKHHTNFWKRR